MALGDAVDEINAAEDRIALPVALHGDFQGAARAFSDSLGSEPILILAALVTVYIVLGVLYESYIHPITILSTLPSAGVGAFLALIICGQEFSIIALIGIVLLIGIVKKNAIMMIDFALEAERERGKTPREAIHEACLLRFRPIMMTTAAALLGGLPLAFGRGIGAELRRPLGITIVGGLLLSQVLTLFTTPVIYLYMERAAAWVRRKRGVPEGAAAPVAPGGFRHDEPLEARVSAAGDASEGGSRRRSSGGPSRRRCSRPRCCWRAGRRTSTCRSRRCQTSTSRRCRSRRRCRARAPTRWRRRWRRRSSAASGASRASRR